MPSSVLPLSLRSAISPPTQISRTFITQSYFDDTLLQTALLTQASNDPIVNSTVRAEQIPGYAVGLAPWSQTPVAVSFRTGQSGGSSGVLTLKPGQIIRPMGYDPERPQAFSGFQWGLPFGWLGGGLASIFIFPSPDAHVDWIGNPEIPFHHQRMKILATASLPGTATKNWPSRFPWANAFAGAVPQPGTSQLAISEPTRVMMRLRLTSLTSPLTMRMIFRGTTDFDETSTGTFGTDASYYDVVWPDENSAAGNALAYPVIELPSSVARLASDSGGVDLIDLTGSSFLTNAYVDVVRYGRL